MMAQLSHVQLLIMNYLENQSSCLSVSVNHATPSPQNQSWVLPLVARPAKRGKGPGAGGRRVNICFVVSPLRSGPLCAS